MNFGYFVAKRVALNRTSEGQQSFSRLIIRIAVIAVALSVAVMIVATALIRGFKNEISSKIFGFWGHIHITDTNMSRSLLEAFPMDINQDFYPHLDSIQQINYIGPLELGNYVFPAKMVQHQSKGGISHIQSFALKPGIIKTKKTIEGIILKGVGKDFNWHFFEQYLLRGRSIDLPEEGMSREILISQQTANRLEVDTGSTFIVHFVERGEQLQRRFNVVGVYKTGLEEYDQRFALVDLRQIQRLLGWEAHQISGFEVFIDHIDDLIPITEHIYYQHLPNNLYAETIREKFPNIFEWLELQNINEVVILALMLIVSIINMVTALMILILERTNMIGTLKALGSRNWDIQKVFLYYAAYIIALGLFWGNLVGLLLCFIQDKFQIIQLSEADYYLSYAPIEINFWTILLLNLGTLVAYTAVFDYPLLFSDQHSSR